jgi:hypothetical protein
VVSQAHCINRPQHGALGHCCGGLWYIACMSPSPILSWSIANTPSSWRDCGKEPKWLPHPPPYDQGEWTDMCLCVVRGHSWLVVAMPLDLVAYFAMAWSYFSFHHAPSHTHLPAPNPSITQCSTTTLSPALLMRPNETLCSIYLYLY